MRLSSGGQLLVFDAKTLSLLLLVFVQLWLCSADHLIRTKLAVRLKVSTIITDTHTRWHGSSLIGFIPEFLRELEKRGGIDVPYDIVEATYNELGTKYPNQTWGPGLIHDVLKTTDNFPVMGAGPILDKGEHMSFVAPSKPWADVWLTIVVHKNTSVSNMETFVQKGLHLGVISDSSEYQELEKFKDHGAELSGLHQRWLEGSATYSSIESGLYDVENKYIDGLLLNSEDARYQVSFHFCHLKFITRFHSLGNYVFVFHRGSLHLEKLNEVIQNMKDDGSLDDLRNREIGIPNTCSKAHRGVDALRWVPIAASLLAAAVLRANSVQILF